MSPNRVFWVSFTIFGLAAAVDVGLDLARYDVGIGTLASALGVVAIGYASLVALRDPERANVPNEWGPLVYFVVAGAALYTAGLALQLSTVFA